MAERTNQYTGPIKTFSYEHHGQVIERQRISRNGKWIRIGDQIYTDESTFPSHERLAHETKLEQGKTLAEAIADAKRSGQTTDIDGGDFKLRNASEPNIERYINVTGHSSWLEHTLGISYDEVARQKSLELWQQLSRDFTVTGEQTRRSPLI